MRHHHDDRAPLPAAAAVSSDPAAVTGQAPRWQVHTGDWRALLDVVPRCDALIVDAPYSEKTHSGHRSGVGQTAKRHECERRDISYDAWTPHDVEAFVHAWAPRTAGWIVTITDDQLASAWASALRISGRYAFAPLPYVAPGSRVRLVGDGPSCWACWIVVARPRHEPYCKWGTLPGAYILPPGQRVSGPGTRIEVIGEKPLWLMERLVEDYSRPGDLVCDPCCGSGTTLLAAIRLGRSAIGGDILPEHAELSRERLRAEDERSTLQARRAGQRALFGSAT